MERDWIEECQDLKGEIPPKYVELQFELIASVRVNAFIVLSGRNDPFRR